MDERQAARAIRDHVWNHCTHNEGQPVPRGLVCLTCAATVMAAALNATTR